MLKSNVGKAQPRTQQGPPPDVAIDAINADERLEPKSGVLLNRGVFDHEPRTRQHSKRDLAKSDVAVESAFQSLLEATAVPFRADVRGNEPSREPAGQKSQQGDPSASVDPRAHQRTSFTAIPPRRRTRNLISAPA
jgi:hypothetical protein